MGDFRITIDAVGGHGCNREVKDGGTNYGCGRMSCPDCMAREFVAHMKAKGVCVNKAELIHWPKDYLQPDGTLVHQPDRHQIADDLVTGKRKGSF